MKNILTILILAPAITAQALNEADHEQTAALHQSEEGARMAMLNAQASELAEIWSENLIVNTPRLGIAGDRKRLLAAVEAGAVAYEHYDQIIEKVRIEGDTAIIMGSETARTGPNSEPIRRSFTHTWIHREGRWRLLARHAHQMKE